MSYRDLPMSIIDQLVVEYEDDQGQTVRRSVFIHKGGYYHPSLPLIESFDDAVETMAQMVRGVRVAKLEHRQNVRGYWHPDKTFTVELP